MRVTYAEEKINGSASNYIYNAMIAPLTPYSIKGVIWYQGESNRGDHNYFEKLKALVEGWSKDFRVKNLPLLQVQIAPWDYTRGQKPKDHTLGDTIWKAQYKAAKELPRVGLIPIHDTNIDINDIHPQHKLQVGERLAALALNDHYSVKKYCRAPEFDKALITKNKLVINFKNLSSNLTTFDNKAVKHFEISTDGKKFNSAVAIKGKTIEIMLDETKRPKFVRMGWCDTAIPNLSEENGWPVYAFPAKLIE